MTGLSTSVNPKEETENDVIVAEDVESHRDEFNVFSPRSPCDEKPTDDHQTVREGSESQLQRIDQEHTNEDLIGGSFVDDNRQAVSLWLDMGWLSAWW